MNETSHNITKTNFFCVKDAEVFREFVAHIKVHGSAISLHEQTDHKGRLQFAFCTKGELAGYSYKTPGGDVKTVYDVDALCDELMTHIADHDAMIIFQFGNDATGTVAGCAKILTNTGNSFIDLRGMAIEKAAEMLELPAWTTTLLD